MRPPPPPKPAGPLLWIGGPIDRVTVTLRFFGPDLDPGEVTRLLRCKPTKCYHRGEELPGRYHRVATHGSWHLRIDEADVGLEDQIHDLLDKLPDDPAVWAKLRELSTEAGLFCGLFLDAWNRGADLSPDLLQRLGQRQLRLGLDIYCDGSTEGEDRDGIA